MPDPGCGAGFSLPHTAAHLYCEASACAFFNFALTTMKHSENNTVS